ncbi:MAG: DUF4147 domain-containing protein [Bacteroidales bacterium]|jgi:hydroxypyruvate reductase/glycerate 2-kinase|nr:DUF4147 domain-containing protein [Bacteroidales bacterium]
MNNREIAEHIFLAGIKGVLPEKLISDLILLRKTHLKIGYLSYNLGEIKSIYIIGAGKASAAMAHYVEKILGRRITDGFVVTKYGHSCKLKYIKVAEAGHPVPDENSFGAAEEMLKITGLAGKDDLVICLWSGGGSSLLADHPVASSPVEISFLNDMLVNCGADIREMNAVRKHLSKIKGGQLTRSIWPAAGVSIMLSDVIGDHPDVIASGPTSPDNSTFTDALKVIESHNLKNDIPPGLLKYLIEGTKGIHPETPKPGDPVFKNVGTILAGNNKTALRAAKDESEKLGYNTIIVTNDMAGDVNEACSFIIDTVCRYKNDNNIQMPVCLLFGGETTVTVTGEGSGGRNQHLALLAAIRLQHIPGVTFLSGGTDGNDGNTDMAGAVVDSETVHTALSMNTDPERFLADFDSFHFFSSTGGHIFTGPTMTNVMDLAVVIIE